MKEKILILFIFCLQQVYFGQVSVVQETIEGSTNRLLLNIGKGYLINDYIDRAEREISDTPLIDLFVSVPVDEIPKLDFRIINSEKIEPKYLNENYGRGNLYTIRGFLWIKDQYCMHVSINPVFFNESDRSFHNISYLELTLTFKGRINDLSLETKKVTPAVLNKKFASGNPAAKKVRYTVTPKNDWIDFTSEYLKIGVADDGIYRITYQSLARMDVAVGMINPKTFRLQSRGVDIPIYVFGEED
ncbi:MAG: hypothetical protein KKG93_08195, partial [Bacteroidetes bacterium]|nr:hypothetical protein [Bacteroidota bacterium]